ncbi:MAG: hypothetical protein K2L64_00730 [Ureaplasma sp.]|nr:hypothetical protein [Ureaplasma sp.]
MTKKQKKTLLYTLTGVLAPGIILPPTIIAVKHIQYNENASRIENAYNNGLVFNNRVFNSKDELLQYAMNAVSYTNNVQEIPVKYNIANDPIETSFKDKVQLDEYINKKISVKSASNSLEYRKNASNQIIDNDIKYFIDSENKEETTIYRGKNNSYYTDELEAKDTYFQPHSAYFWKNTYFRNKEELKKYLIDNVEELWDSKPKSIVLKAPNGQKSQRIVLSDFGNPDRVDSVERIIKNFVRVNATTNIVVQEDNGDEMFFTKDTISNFMQNFPITYTRVNSNDNFGTIITDVLEKDEGRLSGNYYTKSSSTTANFADKRNWNITNSVDRQFQEEYNQLKRFSSFFDTALLLSAEPIGLENNSKIFSFFWSLILYCNLKLMNILKNFSIIIMLFM